MSTDAIADYTSWQWLRYILEGFMVGLRRSPDAAAMRTPTSESRATEREKQL